MVKFSKKFRGNSSNELNEENIIKYLWKLLIGVLERAGCCYFYAKGKKQHSTGSCIFKYIKMNRLTLFKWFGYGKRILQSMQKHNVVI